MLTFYIEWCTTSLKVTNTPSRHMFTRWIELTPKLWRGDGAWNPGSRYRLSGSQEPSGICLDGLACPRHLAFRDCPSVISPFLHCQVHGSPIYVNTIITSIPDFRTRAHHWVCSVSIYVERSGVDLLYGSFHSTARSPLYGRGKHRGSVISETSQK